MPQEGGCLIGLKGCAGVLFLIFYGLIAFIGISFCFAINPILGLLAVCVVGAAAYLLFRFVFS